MLPPAPFPTLFAHRGLAARYPENTLASFAAARREGCRAVEFDVQLSADGVPVVFHDDDLARLTGDPRRVDALAYAELRRVDVGAFKGARFAHERIPTLDETLAAWGGAGLVNLELKAGGEALCRQVHARLAGAAGVVVSSFEWPMLEAYRRLDPGAVLAVLFEGDRWPEAMAFAGRIGAAALNPDAKAATAEALAAARAAGYGVNVFTVNDARLAAELVARGATGLFSDDAPALAAALGGAR